jgi:hypothetical protein
MENLNPADTLMSIMLGYRDAFSPDLWSRIATAKPMALRKAIRNYDFYGQMVFVGSETDKSIPFETWTHNSFLWTGEAVMFTAEATASQLERARPRVRFEYGNFGRTSLEAKEAKGFGSTGISDGYVPVDFFGPGMFNKITGAPVPQGGLALTPARPVYELINDCQMIKVHGRVTGSLPIAKTIHVLCHGWMINWEDLDA